MVVVVLGVVAVVVVVVVMGVVIGVVVIVGYNKIGCINNLSFFHKNQSRFKVS